MYIYICKSVYKYTTYTEVQRRTASESKRLRLLIKVSAVSSRSTNTPKSLVYTLLYMDILYIHPKEPMYTKNLYMYIYVYI